MSFNQTLQLFTIRILAERHFHGNYRVHDGLRHDGYRAGHCARDVRSAGALVAPHPTAPIAALSKLAGVGPATASAILAAAKPEMYPFFDELVAAQIPDMGKLAFTLGYYARYAEALLLTHRLFLIACSSTMAVIKRVANASKLEASAT